MASVAVTVIRRTPNENLGRFGITTFQVDDQGVAVGSANPKASHWRVTWAPEGGGTHAHPPVYKDVHRQTLDFDTEAQAREGCRRAIQKFFDPVNPSNIEVN